MKPKRSHAMKIRQLAKGRIALLLGIVALFVLSLYATFWTNLFTVVDLQVNTSYKDINIERVQQVLSPEVVGQNALFLDLEALETTSYELFPDVSSMGCHRNWFVRRVVCDAIGYELVAVIKHLEERYYINENGVIIAYDNRKLGLPLFDLILNPVFAGLTDAQRAELEASLDSSVSLDPLSAPTIEPVVPEEPIVIEEPADANSPARLTFIQPTEEPPIEPVIKNEGRRVFEVEVGKKILDPEELKTILEALKETEDVLGRKVIQAQYVQVAGELSLTSKPAPREEGEEEVDIVEDPDHEMTILLDLRRNLEDQFTKLKKTKEVIDFTTVDRIDLSIDGEKVFYVQG